MRDIARESGRIPVDCEDCQASFDGLCEACAREMQQILAKYKSGERTIEAGSDLFRPNEPCHEMYSLLDGWLFLYILLDGGRRQILHFSLPGAILGLYPARAAAMTYGAQALTDAIVGVVPNENLRPLSKAHPEVAMRLAWLVSRDCGLAYEHLSSVGRHSARRRVAYLLLELFARSQTRRSTNHTGELHLPLTQKHIADATGLTSVHVNRELRALQRKAVVEFRYRRLRILDPVKLIDAAGVDPQLATSWF